MATPYVAVAEQTSVPRIHDRLLQSARQLPSGE
ncbi:hypothetical protein X945_6016 [Burkholderia pseudomallei ABCPW 107]|nr:hypothetical protein X945_6016 [Burkholderia pseudomallei ABCPW 107]